MLLYLKSLNKTINRYFDLSFALKFLVLFAVFYYANMYFVRLILPGEHYNAFADRHLNYIDGITGTIMHTANFLTRAVGIDTHVVEPRYLVGPAGNKLVMGWPCVGLGILSFWAAFVLANKMTLRKKLIWLMSGFLVIWILNCLRTALLMIALEKNVKEWKKSWAFGRTLDHHDLFTYACYIFLFGLIYFFYRRFKPGSQRKEKEE